MYVLLQNCSTLCIFGKTRLYIVLHDFNLTYYSSIILGSFSILLFPKLCWYIGLTPSDLLCNRTTLPQIQHHSLTVCHHWSAVLSDSLSPRATVLSRIFLSRDYNQSCQRLKLGAYTNAMRYKSIYREKVEDDLSVICQPICFDSYPIICGKAYKILFYNFNGKQRITIKGYNSRTEAS